MIKHSVKEAMFFMQNIQNKTYQVSLQLTLLITVFIDKNQNLTLWELTIQERNKKRQ